VSYVAHVFVEPVLSYVINMLINFKQIDVKWFFVVIICDKCIRRDFRYSSLYFRCIVR